MGININFRKMTLGMKIIYSVVAIGIVAAIVIAIVVSRNGYQANTMRLLRVEGTVNIESGNGGTKPVLDNIRFQSGDALNTGADGLASVGLDDSKIVTLQNDSRAEFSKSGKRLELKLTKGALFFNVTEKLNDDETFEIKTSTMTAGIRGTSGYVYYDDEGRDSLVITDGVVIVTAINPETGEKKYAEVRGGQNITVYLYSDRTQDSVEFEITDVSENDLPAFPLQMLAENDELMNRVCAFTGWDKATLTVLVNTAISDGANTPASTGTPTPTPNANSTATPTPKPGSTATPTPSSTPSPTPEPEETEETKETDPDATSTPTPTPAPTATNSPVPTATPTTTPTATPTTEPVATPTDKPVPTPTERPKPSTNPEPSTNSEPSPNPEPEPTPVEREIVSYDVTVEISIPKTDPGLTDPIPTGETEEDPQYTYTIEDVPVNESGDGPDRGYIDNYLFTYYPNHSGYTILSSEPNYA